MSDVSTSQILSSSSTAAAAAAAAAVGGGGGPSSSWWSSWVPTAPMKFFGFATTNTGATPALQPPQQQLRRGSDQCLFSGGGGGSGCGAATPSLSEPTTPAPSSAAAPRPDVAFSGGTFTKETAAVVAGGSASSSASTRTVTPVPTPALPRPADLPSLSPRATHSNATGATGDGSFHSSTGGLFSSHGLRPVAPPPLHLSSPQLGPTTTTATGDTTTATTGSGLSPCGGNRNHSYLFLTSRSMNDVNMASGMDLPGPQSLFFRYRQSSLPLLHAGSSGSGHGDASAASPNNASLSASQPPPVAAAVDASFAPVRHFHKEKDMGRFLN